MTFGDADVVVECASDSVIPKFTRVTLDNFWRARIDVCMHGLVQPQAHLARNRNVFCLHVFSAGVWSIGSSMRWSMWTSTCCVWPLQMFVLYHFFRNNWLGLFFVNSMIKSRILSCARELRERLTHLQSEELDSPTEDDEPIDEPVIEPVDENHRRTCWWIYRWAWWWTRWRTNKSSSKKMSNLSKVCMLLKSMLKRVHAHQRHPSNGLKLCLLLLHTNAPPEILAVEKISLPPLWSDHSADKTSPTCASVSWHRTWTHRFNWCESLEEKRRWTGSDHREHHRWSFEVPCRSGSKKVKRSETRQQWTTLKLSKWIGFLFAKKHQLSSAWTPKMHSNLMSLESGAPLDALNFQWRQMTQNGKIGIVECHIRLLKNQLTISDARWASRCVDRRVRWTLCGCQSETTDVLMDTIRYNDGLELNTWTKRKSITLWTSTGSSNSCPNSLRSCWRSEDLAHGPSMRGPRVLINWTVGQLVRYFDESKKWGRWRSWFVVLVALVQQECWRLNSELKWKSKITAVIWLAHGRSLIKAASRAFGGLFRHLIPHCWNCHFRFWRYLVPHGFWDLRNSKRTENADVGEPSDWIRNVWMLGKIPMVENSNNEVIFSHQHQMQMLCLPSNSRITNSQRILWDFLSVFHLVSMLFDLLTVLDIFSHDQIHIRAHTMSQQTHLACELNDGPFLVMDSQIVLMRQIILWYAQWCGETK